MADQKIAQILNINGISYTMRDKNAVAQSTFNATVETLATKQQLTSATANFVSTSDFNTTVESLASKDDLTRATEGFITQQQVLAKGYTTLAAVEAKGYVTQTSFNTTIGDINSVLDEINGEVL